MRLPRAFFVYLLFLSVGFLILLTNIKIPSARYLAWRNFFLHVIAPALWSAEEFVKDRANLPSNVIEMVTARKENVFLKKKILEYERALTSYMALLDENDFLRKTQQLHGFYLGAPGGAWRGNYKLVAVNIILRDPSAWALGCLVNGGKRQGIKKNSAVVATMPLALGDNSENPMGDGMLPYRDGSARGGRFVLVGKISEVLEDVSEVMFVTNPMFAVPALIPSSGCEGLLEYFSSDTAILNYPSKASAPIGSDVVVSDSSRLFPPRLYIGNVISNKRLSDGILVSPAFLKQPLNRFVVIVKD